MTDWREPLRRDYDRFTLDGLPKPFEPYILEHYGIDLASTYAGLPIRNPFGKASGQLSLNLGQITRDRDAGLAFVVLKTLIAEDDRGAQSMKAWRIPATRMTVEPILGTRPGVKDQRGWTVTWKGRGWSESFEKYLELFRTALEESLHSMLVIPSVKFHLPKPGETEWLTSEYEFTARALHDVWVNARSGPMPIEKDFSPTLAGDHTFSDVRDQILHWLRTVPRLLHETSVGRDLLVGVKLFNAAHSDEFQIEMVRALSEAQGAARADHLIYGNRLFDPAKSYEGSKGVAYGGPDLSDRNLQVLDAWIGSGAQAIPFSATGNIITGRQAFEYMKRGAASFQMHTIFQLPDSEFDMKAAGPAHSRTERALHRLLFHPEHGFLAARLEGHA